MGKQKKLLWKLFQSHIVITLLSLISIALFASQSLKVFYIGQVRDDLIIRAELFSKMIPEGPPDNATVEINKLCRETGPGIDTRITVILPDGVVIGDSDEDIAVMDNHGDRPEIHTALSGEIGMSTRYSYTLKKELMYVAIPLMQNDTVAAVVRTSHPVSTVASSLREVYAYIAVIMTIIMLVVVFASFILSRNINSQITGMLKGADRFARGELDYRITVNGIAELETLANGMNTMASQLSERITTISEQRNEIEAILSGMIEAVIAVDNEGNIIEYNRAAESLFGMRPKDVQNIKIHEALRNTSIYTIVENVLSTQMTLEDEIVYQGAQESILTVRCTPLFGSDRRHMGAVLVFNDITHLKKLENVRRDFVANVSHELKTPISAIIGFLETLNDGAMDDTENRQRFLDIVLKHSKRLNSIVEDLLSLSRLEQKTEGLEIEFEKTDICSIISSVAALYEKTADQKNITITQTCQSVFLNCNSTLLAQAIGNLVDNAVKYSHENSEISITASQNDKSVIVKITDSGIGIPPEHTDRIFERFYRVDKGRSRDLGGTGLGLAIAQHIVFSHNGTISVQSIPGIQTTFTITLPVY